MNTMAVSRVPLLLWLVGVAGAVVSCPNTTEDGVQCRDLIPGKYCMSWKVLEGEGVIEFSMAWEGQGARSPWMAVGVSPAGGMRGADILAVHRALDGEWTVSDMFGVDYEPPVLDERQHVTLVKAAVTGTVVTATVQRPLDSCEFHDNAVVKGFAHPVIWAVGEGTDLTGWGAKHLERGTMRLVLWEDAKRPVPVANDSGLFEVKLEMPRVVVPAAPPNSYMCMTFDLGQLTGKDFDTTEYHMVEFAPLLQGAPGLVHHMLLMTCVPGTPMYPEVKTVCPDMDMLCSEVATIWAMGGSPVTLPDEAGLQIGKTKGKQMWLQVHYYNPKGIAGKVDTSGITLKITPVLRKEHAGIIAFGPAIPPEYPPIPPGKTSHVVRSTCAECMATHFDADEVTVVAGMAHAHFLASKITTHVIRDGKNIGPAYELKRYDYNHQLFVQSSITKLRRGDVLETTCEYNSMTRENPTHFGEGSQEEMCFSFLLYYPRQPRLGWCYDFDWRNGSWGAQYAPQCEACRNDPTWSASFVQQQATERGCDDEAKRGALAATGNCPPCAANGTCKTADYIAYWRPTETFCPYFCSLGNPHDSTPYVCAKALIDRHKSYTAGKKIGSLTSPPQECSPKAAVRTVADNCKVHTDCPTGKYCRNGRKVLSEAEGLLWCSDCSTCCKRQDAVGGAGETDRLYRCPASCGCQQSVQSCAREGEVLCRGCCSMDPCVDSDEDGRKLLQTMKQNMTCTEMGKLVEAGAVTKAALDQMCAVGLNHLPCKMLGITQCEGVAYLRKLCPVLCGACPRCTLDRECTQCTAPSMCTSSVLDVPSTTSHCAEGLCTVSPVTPTPSQAKKDPAGYITPYLPFLLLPTLLLPLL